MTVRDLDEEKLTARRVEPSSSESVRLLLRSDGMGFSFISPGFIGRPAQDALSEPP